MEQRFAEDHILEEINKFSAEMVSGQNGCLESFVHLKDFLDESDFRHRSLDYFEALSSRTFALLWLLNKLLVDGLWFNIPENMALSDSDAAMEKVIYLKIASLIGKYIQEFQIDESPATLSYILSIEEMHNVLVLYNHLGNN